MWYHARVTFILCRQTYLSLAWLMNGEWTITLIYSIPLIYCVLYSKPIYFVLITRWLYDREIEQWSQWQKKANFSLQIPDFLYLTVLIFKLGSLSGISLVLSACRMVFPSNSFGNGNLESFKFSQTPVLYLRLIPCRVLRKTITCFFVRPIKCIERVIVL